MPGNRATDKVSYKKRNEAKTELNRLSKTDCAKDINAAETRYHTAVKAWRKSKDKKEVTEQLLRVAEVLCYLTGPHSKWCQEVVKLTQLVMTYLAQEQWWRSEMTDAYKALQKIKQDCASIVNQIGYYTGEHVYHESERQAWLNTWYSADCDKR